MPLPRPRLLAVATAALLAGCATPRFGLPDPASTRGDDTLPLWQGAVVTALVIATLVWVLVLTAVIRYRRAGSGEIPSQRADHRLLEAVYTAVPIVIVAVLFAFTLATLHTTDELDPNPDLEVEIVGFQWQWQFNYPAQGITITGDDPLVPPELVLPVGAVIRLDLRAIDVIHALWIPELLVKRDLVPGLDNQIDLEITREGRFVSRCAEFCGLDHTTMTFTVRAVSQADFDEWVAAQ